MAGARLRAEDEDWPQAGKRSQSSSQGSYVEGCTSEDRRLSHCCGVWGLKDGGTYAAGGRFPHWVVHHQVKHSFSLRVNTFPFFFLFLSLPLSLSKPPHSVLTGGHPCPPKQPAGTFWEVIDFNNTPHATPAHLLKKKKKKRSQRYSGCSCTAPG